MTGKNKMIIAAIMAVMTVFGCRESDYADHPDGIVMTPDYKDIVIPFNIAPLNFSLGGKRQGRSHGLRSTEGLHVQGQGFQSSVSVERMAHNAWLRKGEQVTGYCDPRRDFHSGVFLGCLSGSY